MVSRQDCISHIDRVKLNLATEGKQKDWFSTMDKKQNFVILGPRKITNLPIPSEGAMGCREPLQGLASITVHN